MPKRRSHHCIFATAENAMAAVGLMSFSVSVCRAPARYAEYMKSSSSPRTPLLYLLRFHYSNRLPQRTAPQRFGAGGFEKTFPLVLCKIC